MAAALTAVFAEAREAWFPQAAWAAGDMRALATMVSQTGRVERILYVVVAPEQRGAAVEAPSAEALRDRCLLAARAGPEFYASSSRAAGEALACEPGHAPRCLAAPAGSRELVAGWAPPSGLAIAGGAQPEATSEAAFRPLEPDNVDTRSVAAMVFRAHCVAKAAEWQTGGVPQSSMLAVFRAWCVGYRLKPWAPRDLYSYLQPWARLPRAADPRTGERNFEGVTVQIAKPGERVLRPGRGRVRAGHLGPFAAGHPAICRAGRKLETSFADLSTIRGLLRCQGSSCLDKSS